MEPTEQLLQYLDAKQHAQSTAKLKWKCNSRIQILKSHLNGTLSTCVLLFNSTFLFFYFGALFDCYNIVLYFQNDFISVAELERLIVQRFNRRLIIQFSDIFRWLILFSLISSMLLTNHHVIFYFSLLFVSVHFVLYFLSASILYFIVNICSLVHGLRGILRSMFYRMKMIHRSRIGLEFIYQSYFDKLPIGSINSASELRKIICDTFTRMEYCYLSLSVKSFSFTDLSKLSISALKNYSHELFSDYLSTLFMQLLSRLLLSQNFSKELFILFLKLFDLLNTLRACKVNLLSVNPLQNDMIIDNMNTEICEKKFHQYMKARNSLSILIQNVQNIFDELICCQKIICSDFLREKMLLYHLNSPIETDTKIIFNDLQLKLREVAFPNSQLSEIIEIFSRLTNSLNENENVSEISDKDIYSIEENDLIVNTPKVINQGKAIFESNEISVDETVDNDVSGDISRYVDVFTAVSQRKNRPEHDKIVSESDLIFGKQMSKILLHELLNNDILRKINDSSIQRINLCQIDDTSMQAEYLSESGDESDSETSTNIGLNSQISTSIPGVFEFDIKNANIMKNRLEIISRQYLE